MNIENRIDAKKFPTFAIEKLEERYLHEQQKRKIKFSYRNIGKIVNLIVQ